MNREEVDLSKLSVEEKLALLERIYIQHPQSEEILNRIDYIHKHSKIALAPENCLLITGKQGTGKTRLIERYEKRFPRYEVEKETREGIKRITIVPVLTASIPGKATDKALISELLYRLGDPCASVGSTTYLTLRLWELIDDCGVEIIILDEFQHFIDRDSEKIRKNVANCLKDILLKTKKPMVLAGMPNSASILDDNPQLSRRFSKRMGLTPLKWNEDEETDCEFKIFLNYLDKALPLPRLSNLSEHKMAFRIYSATAGIIANIMNLTRRAASFAISRSKNKVKLVDFFDAYIDQLADANPQDDNPFEEGRRRPRAKRANETPSKQEGASKRVKPKEKKDKASEILRRR